MKELIKINTNEEGKQLVSARELYLGLGLNQGEWSRWYKRNIEQNEYFNKNVDWVGFVITPNRGGKEVKDLKDNMPLFQVDCKELQAIVRKKGIEVLGGKDKPSYKDNSIRGKVYSDIQHQLKREFGVTRYEAIKRSQLGIATEIVDNYKVPTVLAEEIEQLNNQLQFN